MCKQNDCYLKKISEIIKTIFNQLDANKDGHITPDELVSGGDTVGIKISLSKASRMVGELDKDGEFQYL